MRAQLFGLALAVVALSGCDGGGDCIIDSDCADFTNVCIDRTCVPAGSVQRDSGPPATVDAGPRIDAGSDAGEVADAGGDAAAPACTDVAGPWAITTVTGTCGSAVVGYRTSIESTASCAFTAMSADTAMPALDGSFSVDASNAITGTLNVGGLGERECTGMVNTDATLSVVCGECTLVVTRG